MIKNFFLSGIRNFWKNRVTSIIKIVGLATGLSAVLLIYVYVSFERSYDNYHINGDRIYRVAYHLKHTNFGEYNNAGTGHRLAPMLQDNFPEIEAASRISWFGEVNITWEDQNYKEQKFVFADPSLLTMFSFPMKQGDRNTALDNRKSIIISSRIAHKYFGDENPLGKYLDDNLQLKVTGVIDVPDNSHFRFDILAPYNTIYDIFPYYKSLEDKDIDNGVYTYILLRKDSNPSELQQKFPQFINAHVIKGDYSSVKLFLEPLEKIHLESKSEAYLGEFEFSKFTKDIISLFQILGLIIIGIACFNFINIAIAHIAGRTLEVGVRKVNGSKKREIFIQFVCEYFIYSLIALLLSVLIVQIFLPYISSILNRRIQINYFEYFIAAIIILFLITILTGAFPSYIVAKLDSKNVLQSDFKRTKGSALKSVLMVSQFVVSIFLILTAIFIGKQIIYFSEMDMGINTKDLLVIKMENSKIRKDYELLKSELLRNPHVLSVSASSNIPGVTGAITYNIQIDGNEPIPFPSISIDGQFTKNLEIKTINGRSFGSDYQTDAKSSFLLNQSAVKQLGIENPIGKEIILLANVNGEYKPINNGQIVGVIDDYSYRPNYEDSKGVVFNNDPNRFRALFVRISPNDQDKTLLMIKDTWGKLFPDITLTINFLKDEMKNDFFIRKLHGLKGFIGAIAIFSFFIALLGLFGLSILNAEKRVKEIGIRKVNGASIMELLIFMNRKFIYLIILSIIISFPIVFLIIEELKKSHPKSTSLSGTNYVIAFLVIVLLTLLTVSWQSWRAATRNPVEALRYE